MTIMKKYIWASMFAAIAMLTGCDYNEDNFEGYNDIKITDVAQYEGEFTGNYPGEGYFTDKASLQNALNAMLKAPFTLRRRQWPASTSAARRLR